MSLPLGQRGRCEKRRGARSTCLPAESPRRGPSSSPAPVLLREGSGGVNLEWSPAVRLIPQAYLEMIIELA